MRIGRELLPNNGGDIQEIYNDSISDEKEAKPKERKTELMYRKFGNDTRTIYTITADDAGITHAELEKLDSILKNFEYQQYTNASNELNDINNKIFHVLVEKKIIEKESIENKTKKLIQKEFSELFGEEDAK